MVDLRINETRQTGEVRKTKLPVYRLVGAVSNCAYSVRLETAPTGGDSVYLFFVFIIIHEERSDFILSISSNFSSRSSVSTLAFPGG